MPGGGCKGWPGGAGDNMRVMLIDTPSMIACAWSSGVVHELGGGVSGILEWQVSSIPGGVVPGGGCKGWPGGAGDNMRVMLIDTPSMIACARSSGVVQGLGGKLRSVHASAGRRE